MKGTTLANYVVFKSFVKDENGKICGATLYDSINQKEFTVKTKVVVNCAGQHADKIRLQDNDKTEEKQLSYGIKGTHLVFKKGMLPKDSGIVIPKTTKNNAVFITNYMGHPMVGSYDEKCDIHHFCTPT